MSVTLGNDKSPDRNFRGIEPYRMDGEVLCAPEGGVCECHGLVRYGYLSRGGMAGPRAVWGKLDCRGVVIGDPWPYVPY